MATVNNFGQQNQQDDQQDQQQPPAAQPIQMGGSSGGGAAPQGSAAAPGITSAPTKSGRFTNLQQYVKANQPYNQSGGGFAGQIAQNVQGKAQGIQSQFGQAENQFKQQAEQNRQQYNPEQVQQALANPSEYAKNDQNVSNFQKMYNASYQGPQSIEGSDKYNQQAQQLQSLANLSKNEKDRPALLQQLYGSPNYTGGQRNLDTLLLQAQPGQLNALQSIMPTATNAANDINSRSAAASQQAQQYGQEAQQTAQQTQAALSQEQNARQSALQNILQQTQGQRADEQKAELARLGQGQLTADEAKNFGLSSGQALYNTDLSRYYTPGQDASLYNVAKPEDYAQFSALSKLAGQQGGSTFLPEEYAKQAGTLGASFNLDPAQLQHDVKNADLQYQNARANPAGYNPAGGSYSINDMQSQVNSAMNSPMFKNWVAAGADPNNPATWPGQAGAQLRDQISQIKSFNQQFNAGSGVFGSGRNLSVV